MPETHIREMMYIDYSSPGTLPTDSSIDKCNEILPHAYSPFQIRNITEHALTVHENSIPNFISIHLATPVAETMQHWRWCKALNRLVEVIFFSSTEMGLKAPPHWRLYLKKILLAELRSTLSIKHVTNLRRRKHPWKHDWKHLQTQNDSYRDKIWDKMLRDRPERWYRWDRIWITDSIRDFVLTLKKSCSDSTVAGEAFPVDLENREGNNDRTKILKTRRVWNKNIN